MKRVVVKVGSAVLTQNSEISLERMGALVDFLAVLREQYEVVLVSSGSVGAGYTKLKLDRKIIENKQALASIGQPILMNKYAQKFEKYDILTSQVLVTAANLRINDDTRRIKNTIDTLLKNRVLPILNENDATATDELVVGDNDQLSAYVTNHIDADMLIILSDIDGYYDKDPRKFLDAKVLKIVNEVPKDELDREATPHGDFATGGIVTKLKAAAYLLNNNKSMLLTSGFDLDDAKSFLIDKNHNGGTYFIRG
ncbi:MAG: glutamate 5-kinase [Campylobacterales bacterium]|nr:glutamate 5-kinase [Campylobacterales bacterium]